MDEKLSVLLPNGDETRAELLDKYKACFVYVAEKAGTVDPSFEARLVAVEAEHAKLLEVVRNLIVDKPAQAETVAVDKPKRK